MTIKSSGSLSMSEINAEFGLGNSLNSYRGVGCWNSSGNYVTLPSGAISFDDFYGLSYGTSALTFINDYTEGGSFQTSFTFSGCSFGAADITRRIFVVAHSYNVNEIPNYISAVTIGGVSATIHCATSGAQNNGLATAICSAKIPTGTSGTIVVTNAQSLAANYSTIGVFRAVYLQDNSPIFAQHYNIAGATNPASATVDIPAGGICLAGIGAYRFAVRNHTWGGTTGIVERYDNPLGSQTTNFSGASIRTASALTNVTVQATSTLSNGAATTDVVHKRFAVLTWK